MIEKVTQPDRSWWWLGAEAHLVSTTPQAATSAQLNGPTGMVFDASGNFYISDQNISMIEKMNTSGQIYSFAAAAAIAVHYTATGPQCCAQQSGRPGG